jgi:hypothetical protein
LTSRARPMCLPLDFAVVVPDGLIAVTLNTMVFPTSRRPGT